MMRCSRILGLYHRVEIASVLEQIEDLIANHHIEVDILANIPILVHVEVLVLV